MAIDLQCEDRIGASIDVTLRFLLNEVTAPEKRDTVKG
jgi:hypothetical protein